MDQSDKNSILSTHYNTLLGAWSTYNAWFTAFLAINLAALTFLYSQENSKIFVDGDLYGFSYGKVVCFTWAAFNIFGIVSSCLMSVFTKKTMDLCASIIGEGSTDVTPPIAKVGVYGGYANAVSLVLFLVLWIALGLQ